MPASSARTDGATEPKLLTRWGQTAAAFLVAGLLFAAVLAGGYWVAEQPLPWLALGAWLLVWLLWIPLARLVARTVQRRPISRSDWRLRAPTYLLGGILLSASLLTLRLLADRALHLLFDQPGHAEGIGAFLVQSAVYDLLVYSGILALHHALSYYRRYTRRLVQSAELESQLGRVRLAFLRAQMQPHFLLNTLNLISALIHTDPDKADSMIADLGDLLRVTLESPENQEVPLTRELEYLERYLDIARVRFGSALEIERDIDADAETALVPSLVLQPLVENAIRHGLAEQNGRSRITIAAHHVDDVMRLEVMDNGSGPPGDGPLPLRSGVGTGNTRRRLEQLYGPAQRFELRSRPEGGAVALLELPYRQSTESSDSQDWELLHGHPDSDRRRRAAGA